MARLVPASKPLPAGWQTQVLSSLGVKPTAQAQARLTSFQEREGGSTHNTASFNPLDTKLPEPGSVGYSSARPRTGLEEVQAYPNWASGQKATVATLRQYPSIVAWLRNGVSTARSKAAFSKFSNKGYVAP